MYGVKLIKQKEVMKITGGKGVDVVFDPVGKLIPSLKCVNWGARLVVVGFANGPIEKVPANLLLLKSASIIGLYWGATFGKSII
jgi:NADPH2:quinone reductase